MSMPLVPRECVPINRCAPSEKQRLLRIMVVPVSKRCAHDQSALITDVLISRADRSLVAVAGHGLRRLTAVAVPAPER